jgi:hypothetical protein
LTSHATGHENERSSEVAAGHPVTDGLLGTKTETMDVIEGQTDHEKRHEETDQPNDDLNVKNDVDRHDAMIVKQEVEGTGQGHREIESEDQVLKKTKKNQRLVVAEQYPNSC